MKLTSLTVTFFIVIVFLSSVTYAGFFSPRFGSVPQTGNDLVVFVNFTGVSNPVLYFKGLYDSDWIVFDVEQSNGSVTISESYLSFGLYEYYFVNGSGDLRFPHENATFKVAISSGEALIYGKAKNLSDSDSLTYCAPWSSDYSCNYEDGQGFMISAYGDAFFMTGNSTYEDIYGNLALSPMVGGLGFYDTCDHTKGDFDCDNFNVNDPLKATAPSGARRQASMIRAFWNGYRVSGNLTFRDLALDYTNGSADDCDVWDVVPDYDCGNGDDQGLMIYAYFEAYEQSGDLRYLQIADNLSYYGLGYNGSDFLMMGFFKAYELTGNVTYRGKAANVSLERIDSCRYGGCDVYNHSVAVFAMWDAYEKTGDYRYKISAYEKTLQNFSGSCNPWNNTFRCQNPLEQGMIVDAFFKAYQVLDAEGNKFYSPLMANGPKRLQPLGINVSFGGILKNPVLFYRRYGMMWKSGDISFSGMGFTIPAIDLSYAGVYEYYFYDNYSGARFPLGDGTFKVALSSGNDTFKDIAGNFSGSNPGNLCKPFSNDFTCNYETLQAGMIWGYSGAYFSSSSVGYMGIAERFSSAEIDSSDDIFPSDRFATCDHTDGDYDCDTDSPFNTAPFYDISAPLRQGWMIYSLWEGYEKTGNSSLKVLARDYSYGSSEVCDVWNAVPDYDCGDADSQGLMMLAYFKAYEQSGDDEFLRAARNLSDVGLGMNGSDYLIMGMFSAYDMTGNASYYDKAINVTDSRLDYCVSFGCSAMNFSLSALATWDAYEHTEDAGYMTAAVNKTLASPVTSCDPWNATPDYSCNYPDEQGAMMSLYWKAYQMYAGSLNFTSMNVDLIVPGSVDVDSEFNVSCFVENSGSDFVFNVNVSLYFDAGLNASGNFSYFYDNLSVLENRTLNWTFVANESGDKFFSCNVTAGEYLVSDLEVVTVNASVVDSPVVVQDSGSGSSGSLGALEYVYYNASYDYSDMNGSYSFFDFIVGVPVLDNTVRDVFDVVDNLTEISETSYDISSCYNVSRVFESNSSISLVSRISLSILYQCSNTTLDFFVYDSIPKTFAESASDVDIELSKEGDIFVIDDDPAYMFVFDNASEGEVIYVNYSVNKSIMYDLLDYIERPFVFAVSFDEVRDVTAPLVEIVYPLNESNFTGSVFDLCVRYYDDSDVSCYYYLDGADEFKMVDDGGDSEMYVALNVSSGKHVIVVECVDVYGNSNSSGVVFYVDEDEVVSELNETVVVVDDGMVGQYVSGLLILLAGFLFFYSYVRGYLSYLALLVLLRIMFVLDRVGGVGISMRLYPLMVWLYEHLDVNPDLKKSLCLRNDASKVIRVLELYSLANRTYDSVVRNEVSLRVLGSSLVLMKKLYDPIMREALIDVRLLDGIREKYLFCADRLGGMVSDGS